jgi:hypothetical protein
MEFKRFWHAYESHKSNKPEMKFKEDAALAKKALHMIFQFSIGQTVGLL